jgi:hypothetical protein
MAEGTDRITRTKEGAVRTWQIVSGILIAVVAGLVLYVIPAFVGIQTNLAAIQTELTHLRADVQSASADRWTGKDHNGYAAMVSSKIADLCRRIADLERRINSQPIRSTP